MAGGMVIIATAKAVEGLPMGRGALPACGTHARLRQRAGPDARRPGARDGAGRKRAGFVRERYDTRTLDDTIAARLQGLKRA